MICGHGSVEQRSSLQIALLTIAAGCAEDPFPCCRAGNIEVWLQRLVDGMQSTMKAIIKRAYRNVQEMSFEDFVFSHPAQVAAVPRTGI